MVFEKFRYRSNAPEIIDDFELEGEQIIQTFRSIERINYFLGGNQVLTRGLQRITKALTPSIRQPLVVNDLGCGSGDGLRALARWMRTTGHHLQLIGTDASEFVLDYARSNSSGFPEIKYRQENIFDDAAIWPQADVLTFNLCLHHFSESEQRYVFERARNNGVRVILVNDLHRHWLAYYLFSLGSWVARTPYIARHDGRLSILKGFRKAELIKLAEDAGARSWEVNWCWAFRYRLLVFF